MLSKKDKIVIKQEKIRYWELELTDENHKDLNDWIKTEEMIGLVDEKAGGIIGYINRIHAKMIINKLNRGN